MANDPLTHTSPIPDTEVSGSPLDRTDDYLHALAVPNCLITPSQYADSRRANATIHNPLRRLMFAILDDAIDIYRKYGASTFTARRRMFDEACAWIFDEEDRDDNRHLCFDTVCEALGIDAPALRVGLKRLNGKAAPQIRRLVP